MRFSYKSTAHLAENQLLETGEILTSYVNHLRSIISKANYDDPESSINLPTDQPLFEAVEKMKQQKVSSKLKYFIDIGIGGSNLGTKAVYDALHGCYDVLEPNRIPKIIFLDTNDPTMLSKTVALLKGLKDKEEVLINAISKSGGTTETIVNLELVLQALNERFPGAHDRVVITTDDGSKLHQLAKEKGMATLTMPKSVGGRYSVLSAVGLFPLAACGFDVLAFRKGAASMRDQCISNDLASNPAALSASILFLHLRDGKSINDNFFFLPQLESIGKWYRQLMGESIGKEHDTQGNVVRTGITPTVSLGSTDLHSVGQLYLGGPRDKVTTFISSNAQFTELTLPSSLQFPLIESIAGKTPASIMHAIFEGIKMAYSKQELPFMEVLFDDVSTRSLGEFLQFKMIEMIYLGKLLEVNPFDQPHVELYKVETKKILSEKE